MLAYRRYGMHLPKKKSLTNASTYFMEIKNKIYGLQGWWTKVLCDGKPQAFPTKKWNFDLEDCDKILCIDSEENIVSKIIALLTIHKFYFEELE